MTNQYFWEYINNDFTPHANGEYKSVPLVEVDMPDPELLLKIYETAKAVKQHFTYLPSSRLFGDWFKEDNHDGHLHLPMLDTEEDKLFLLHDTTKTVDRLNDTLFSKHPDFVTSGMKDLLSQLHQQLPFTDLCDIHYCEPGGWLHPHRDLKKDQRKLRLWIPLHEFPPCMKIWPFGWIQNQFGKGYVFDNKKWIHAVYNFADYDRYVLILGIDHDNPPEWLMQQYENNKSNWRQLFSQQKPG
jgi:hypothetical protein